MTHGQIRGWILTVAFVAAVVTHNAILICRQPAAALVIQIQIGATSTDANFLAHPTAEVAVNFDQGRGFNNAKRVLHAVFRSEKTQEIFLPVPTGTIHAIRFDPLAAPGTVRISSFIIQRPRTHLLLRRFDLSQVVAGNQVSSLETSDGALDVTATERPSTGQLFLRCDPPLEVRYSAKQILSGRFFRINAIWLVLGVLLFFGNRFHHAWRSHLLKLVLPIDKTFADWSRRFEHSPFLSLDRTALWFYTLCLIFFAGMAIAGFHGSSITMYGGHYGYGHAKHHPLLGTPKTIRVDEWNYHTPTILNQILRPDRLAAESSQFGPDNAALFGNIPTRHWSEWFRPQFWVFHFLPFSLAFAFYWQTKGLLLLTGIFTLLLLLTRSSLAAVLGALWYFFSAYTQWCYSWPTLLPEMLGLFGWVICLGAYITIGRSHWRLAVAALLCTVFAVDFALCSYPPHQIPLVIFGLALFAWWFLTKANYIFQKTGWLPRALAVSACLLSTFLALGLFYLDVRVGFAELANTVYPGRRSVDGGSVTVAQMFSHFVDFWKNQDHFPLALGNICEGSGYLWLAPVTLLLPRSSTASRQIRLPTLFLWLAFLLLAAWMLLPIPAAIGKFLLLNKVTPYRCLPTLGLINIAIVVVFISTTWPNQGGLAPMHWRKESAFSLGAFILILGALACMNSVYHNFFTLFEISTGSLYATFLVLCLRNRWKRILTLGLLLPAIATTVLINPLDRGFAVIFKSSLAAKIKQHPELKDNRWLVFSSWITLPGFVSACGVNLANGLKIIPSIGELSRFDPEGKYESVINQSCYLIAQVGEEIGASEFQSPNSGVIHWKVNPLDPTLKEIGIKYLAFDFPPDSFIREKLKVILEDAPAGVWAYELP